MARRNMPRLFALCGMLVLSLHSACSQAPREASLFAQTGRFVAAYNARDVEAMIKIVTEDVRWLSVAGATIQTETSGRTELDSAMTGYFSVGIRARSEMRILRQHGNYVFRVEEVMPGAGGESKNQCGVVVCEFEKALIKNAWYYPAYAC